MQVIRLLMTKDRATFKGRHYQLAGASYHPKPIQRPHPPIWIGAGGEQLMLPIVARQADAWHAFGSDDSMTRKSRLLDPLDEVVDRERLRTIWQAVDALPAQQRAAMILKFSEDMTMDEIGGVLGKSTAAAKLLVYRAMQRLRRELAPATVERLALAS